jgi:hypothetical protein
MTSVTYGTRKSLCKVTFDMYQGALAEHVQVRGILIGVCDLFHGYAAKEKGIQRSLLR